MTHLSEHFSLAELTKSALALRHGIDNAPRHDAVLDNMRLLCRAVLEPVRFQFGRPVIVTSGYRSLELNTLCGSKPGSQHCTGQAADFEVPGVANLHLARWIRDHLGFDQLIAEFMQPGDSSAGWVHCSFVNADQNRRDVLTLDGRGVRDGLPEE